MPVRAEQTPLPPSGMYPDATPGATPMAHWFSHPVNGRCPIGAAVGTSGCSWQRHPLAHSLYPSDLFAHGFNNSAEHDVGVPGWRQEEAKTRQNIEALRAAVAALRLPPCGGGGGEARGKGQAGWALT